MATSSLAALLLIALGGAAAPAEAPAEAFALHLLPRTLIYRSYAAGPREPRMSSTPFHVRTDAGSGWLWDSTLGARLPVFRYGSADREGAQPLGWQVDVEGAAFVRLDAELRRDLVSADFRAGVPITYGAPTWQVKVAYYHLISHLGDEFIDANPGVPHKLYGRDAAVLGGAWQPRPGLRVYAEVAYSLQNGRDNGPLELQGGIDWVLSPLALGPGVPLLAINLHARQDTSWGGAVAGLAGYRLPVSPDGPSLTVGLHAYAGRSNHSQFFDVFERQLGLGLFYDF
ncbi:MAG: DUF1207 domain-containing protein [Deltaproteobacteria bacterium]|nr:DUF1207 domain-containing protein [Deltaproteobacteria bacterium]